MSRSYLRALKVAYRRLRARTDGGGCPDCGGALRREGGCPVCANGCGWAECGGGR